MSRHTTFLSRLIGLYCVLIALGLMLHKQVSVDTMNGLIHNPGVLFLTSVIIVAAGLAMILVHNVWSGSAATVLVTLVGWLTLLKGLVFLFLSPNAAAGYLAALHYEQFFYLYLSITLVLGIYLTYAGFSRPASE